MAMQLSACISTHAKVAFEEFIPSAFDPINNVIDIIFLFDIIGNFRTATIDQEGVCSHAQGMCKGVCKGVCTGTCIGVCRHVSCSLTNEHKSQRMSFRMPIHMFLRMSIRTHVRVCVCAGVYKGELQFDQGIIAKKYVSGKWYVSVDVARACLHTCSHTSQTSISMGIKFGNRFYIDVVSTIPWELFFASLNTPETKTVCFDMCIDMC